MERISPPRKKQALFQEERTPPLYGHPVSKPSSARIEVDCSQLVTDLGRPRIDVVETVVAHGRGAPPISRSPASLSF